MYCFYDHVAICSCCVVSVFFTKRSVIIWCELFRSCFYVFLLCCFSVLHQEERNYLVRVVQIMFLCVLVVLFQCSSPRGA